MIRGNSLLNGECKKITIILVKYYGGLAYIISFR